MAVGLMAMPPMERLSNIVAGSALQAPKAAEYTYDTSSVIKADIGRIWASSGTPTSTLALLLAIAEAESGFQNTTGVTGDMGVFQFSPTTWDWACDGEPFNIKDNTLCAIKQIENNQLWHWDASRNDRENYQGWFSRLAPEVQAFVLRRDILCSCVAYVVSKGYKLPLIKTPTDLKSNAMPRIGTLALLRYPIGGGHIAIVRKVTAGGIEIDDANFRRCRETKGRFISWETFERVGRGFYSSP